MLHQVPGWLMNDVIAAGMTAYAEDLDHIVMVKRAPVTDGSPLIVEPSVPPSFGE
jgi:hypothetical protein